jgi:hypothetical protein
VGSELGPVRGGSTGAARWVGQSPRPKVHRQSRRGGLGTWDRGVAWSRGWSRKKKRKKICGRRSRIGFAIREDKLARVVREGKRIEASLERVGVGEAR